jgi:flagellar biosynthesis protein
MTKTPPSKKDLQKKAKKLKRHVEDLELPSREKLKAVAIKYEIGKDKAPKIIATGKGSIAEKIIKLAADNDIPFFEDSTLTDLLSKLNLEQNIPPQLYKLIAEVLAFVYQLDKLAKKRKKVKKAMR